MDSSFPNRPISLVVADRERPIALSRKGGIKAEPCLDCRLSFWQAVHQVKRHSEVEMGPRGIRICINASLQPRRSIGELSA
jgi:hypothetical protein